MKTTRPKLNLRHMLVTWTLTVNTQAVMYTE